MWHKKENPCLLCLVVVAEDGGRSRWIHGWLLKGSIIQIIPFSFTTCSSMLFLLLPVENFHPKGKVVRRTIWKQQTWTHYYPHVVVEKHSPTRIMIMFPLNITTSRSFLRSSFWNRYLTLVEFFSVIIVVVGRHTHGENGEGEIRGSWWERETSRSVVGCPIHMTNSRGDSMTKKAIGSITHLIVPFLSKITHNVHGTTHCLGCTMMMIRDFILFLRCFSSCLVDVCWGLKSCERWWLDNPT